MITIDWSAFTPWHSAAGGVLIGIATAIFLLGDGRIAGIAGIVASPWRSIVTRQWQSLDWTRVAFIAGLLAAPWCWRLFAPLPSTAVDVGPFMLVFAGLLVGVGVRMGNGCTSGHGVCGLSRFSLRSLVNVLAFMGAGALSVFVLRHVF